MFKRNMMNRCFCSVLFFSIALISASPVASVVFAASFGSANSGDGVRAHSEANQDDLLEGPNPDLPWRIFAGAGSGAGWVSSQEYQQAPGGVQVLLSARLSYQIPRWEFDSGIGWLYSRMNGVSSQSAPILIQTRAGVWDLSGRYRFNSHWQLGPILDVVYGADTSFGPVVGNSNMNAFGGLKGVYEFAVQNYPIEIWSQLSTDFTISSVNVFLALAGIQVGLPLSLGKHDYSSDQSLHLSRAAPERNRFEDIRVNLDAQKVFFGTSSSRLKPKTSKALAELGRYLKENPSQFGMVEIDGHADQRGRFEYNLRLSKKRSESVRDALLHGGGNPKRFRTRAYSYLHLLDVRNDQRGWARNRRVEIVFSEVHQPERLRKLLKPLMSETPEVPQRVVN